MSMATDRGRIAPRTSGRWPTSAAAVRDWVLPLSDASALALSIILARVPLGPGLAYAAAVLLLLAADGEHRLRICLRTSDQVPRIAVAGIAPLILLLPSSPGPLLLFGGCSVGLLLSSRGIACTALRAVHRRGALVRGALVIGTDPIAARIDRVLSEHPEYGLAARRFADEPSDTACPVSPDRIVELIRRHAVSRILISRSAMGDEELIALLRSCRFLPVDVCVVPRLHELGMAVPRGHLDELWGIPLIPLRRSPRSTLVAKRMFDVVVGALLLALTAPLLCVLALLTALCHGRPLFRQQRVTRGGGSVEMVKLRTVRAGSDSSWTVRADQCGRFGSWLRGTHLDELPQLFNVLRGSMSLVGPRPERPYYAARFAHEIPGYADRHRIAGGLTGWAQVNGLRGDTSLADRACFDNQYIEYWSLWMDVVIVIRTAALVLAAIARSADIADINLRERP